MEILLYLTDGAALSNLIAQIPTFILLAIIAACLFALVRGADWMIDGVVSLAARTGIPRIVIGATVISLGTTTPEAFVSVIAAWMGNPGLALGNGVGSIVVDTGMIFGLTCILAPIPMNRYILNRTGWVQVGSATLLTTLAVFAWIRMPEAPVLGRGVGILLLLLLAWYLFMAYRWARQEEGAPKADEEGDSGAIFSLSKSWIMLLAGLSIVVVAARILVPCASELAVRVGVPNDVIAATIVAFGTSLPEVMTAISSVRKGHPEITLGNIVGADVLNCLFVIGASAAASPLFVAPNFYTFHFPAMLIILYSFRVFIYINKDGWFKKWQGFWLLAVYLAYVTLQYALNIGKLD